MRSTTPDGSAAEAHHTRTLFVSIGLASSGIFAALTVSPLAAEHVTGTAAWSGLPGTATTLGTAGAAVVLSRRMARDGRRAGLVFGYAVGGAGAAIAAAGVVSASLPALLAGMLLLGFANGSNHQSRYAAAELAPPPRRSGALATVVWASTVGALVGPNVLQPTGAVARSLGVDAVAGPFLWCTVLVFVAAAVDRLGLRGAAATPPSSADRRGSADLAAAPAALVQVAALTLVTAQVVMVLVMTMTPVHIRHGGHSLGIVGLVMSSHIAGMYAFAPAFGRLADRLGTRRVLPLSFVLLASASIGAAFVPNGLPLALPLLLLGLGWSAAFVTGSSLLTEGVGSQAAMRLQGTIDAIVWTSSAAGTLASGLVLALGSFAAVAWSGLALTCAPAVIVLARLRSLPRPALPAAPSHGRP